MNPDKTYLRLFFDLDNTLTRSKSEVTPDMRTLLESIPYTIIVASGASTQQIQSQLQSLPCVILGQNGNHCIELHKDGTETELWRDELTSTEKKEILDHIASLTLPVSVPDTNDLIDDRGSQISYSIYGHHAPVADKEKIDPDQAHRIKMLADTPLESDTITVKIGGTTTLDYFRKGHNKGYNIARLCELQGWNLDDCLYFGDALFPGGNDETVIGVIDTEAVKNPQDTYEKLTLFKKQGK